jgi:hypothetical protein
MNCCKPATHIYNMPDYPPLSCLSDLTDLTFTRNSSISDSIGASSDTDASDASSNDVHDHMVVAGGNNIVQGTGMAPPTTLTTGSTSSPPSSAAKEDCRFPQTCYECMGEANFWDEDSFREVESKTTSDHYTILTGAPPPSTLILTGSPLVYAIPPAYYHGSKSCCEKLSEEDRGQSNARQTWGLPML